MGLLDVFDRLDRKAEDALGAIGDRHPQAELAISLGGFAVVAVLVAVAWVTDGLWAVLSAVPALIAAGISFYRYLSKRSRES